MRFELLVFILVVGVCWASFEDIIEGDRENRWKDDKKLRVSDKLRPRLPYRFNRNCDSLGKHGVKTRVDPETVYPCDYEDDVDCIRSYFVSNGQCEDVKGYNMKPVYRDRLWASAPSINLTWVLTNSRIKYIGDRISRFYINKKTQNLVMSVDFETINIHSKLTYFIYQRRGQEPLILADYTNATFGLTLTAVIPISKGIDINGTKVTAYIARIPSFDIGPNVLNSTEPLAVQVNTAFFNDSSTTVLEYYQDEAPSQFFGYLQNYICDFGVSISN